MQLGNGLFEKKSKLAEDQGKRKKTHRPLCSILPSRQPPTSGAKRLLQRREAWCSFSWKEKHMANSNTSGS